MQKSVAILIESDFFEKEIFYYSFRFLEAGIPVKFVSRLWGQDTITFRGHELQAQFECTESFETLNLDELAAVIVPSGYVADRLRFTEDLNQLPPASQFLKAVFSQRQILKGIICHGLWLAAPIPEVVRNRRLTCHPNLHGDALAYGAIVVDDDFVDDGDLLTARTGQHAHLLIKNLIRKMSFNQENGSL